MNDCLMIGGGVIGLSLAYELACHGLRVRVVDRGPLGREASWAGAGILPPANRDTAVDPLDQLRGLSYELHAEWARRLHDETGIDTGYRRCGGLYLARSPGEAAALRGLAAMFEELRIAIERIDLETLCRTEPALAAAVEHRRLVAAYRLDGECQLRNPRFLKALAAACERRQVELLDGVEVTALESAGGRLQSVTTTAGTMRAATYCFASGAWTRSLLDPLGIETAIVPVRGQMVLFQHSQPLFTRVLNVGSRYLVPREDGRVLAGSTEEEVGFDRRTTPAAIDDLTRFATELVPELGESQIEHVWAGLRPGSLDGLPYLGRLPGLQNAYVAAGHFRSGLFLAPATAVVVGQLIRDELPSVDLKPFSVLRG